MSCLITGCSLFNGFQYAHGDLFKIENCYIFNSCVDNKNEVIWNNEPTDEKVVDFNNYWERRGVIVSSNIVFNEVAQKYIIGA